MTYKEAVRTVATELGLPMKFVDRTYKCYWRAIREHITGLPLKEELTDEEFLSLQPNVNIPSIGKLYVTLDRYRRVRKRYQYVMENFKKKNNDTYKED